MHRFSLIKLFTSFAMLGAEWVMWILIGLSVGSIAIMIERARYFRSLADDLDALANRVNSALRSGAIGYARAALERSPSPAAMVALAGLAEVGRGEGVAEKVMASALARMRPRLDRNLSVLSTIGNNAPFVGLFGTVIGIIQAFDALKPPPGVRGAAAAAAASAATGRVMGTIAEALVATAFGLLVAIPAVAAYNYFHRKVKSMLTGTEALTQIVLAHAHASEANIGDLVKLLRGEVRTPTHDAPEISYAHDEIDLHEIAEVAESLGVSAYVPAPEALA